MNRNLWLLTALQGLFLTNNVTFIAINGLVGLALAPLGWMATLPVMGYVVGGAVFTGPVAWVQGRYGRKAGFFLGLAVAFGSALLCAVAAYTRNFWLLCAATMLAGYYSANGQLYRFTSAELSAPSAREKAVSYVMAGGLIGAVIGPNLAAHTRDLAAVPFAGAYLALAGVALLAAGLLACMRFPPVTGQAATSGGRSVAQLMRQPVFLIAACGGALSYGVMNLLMAATPLAMQQCGLPFSDAAFVLQWHVIGMFAPGFFTGHLIRRFGPLPVMGVGVGLNVLCVAIALSGVELHHFTVALLLLGVGWNFLFTGSTTLSLSAYAPQERNRAQAAINFLLFAVMAVTSFASGALVTTKGWSLLNLGSLVPLAMIAAGLAWLARNRRHLSVSGQSAKPCPPSSSIEPAPVRDS
ncbi:MFS transporter [Acidovorax sp. SUPP3334]|uniref:MFS transporter n=1 Tax=Acidovorax sp. SUPP3334 TaxID=2920881 RepID=UPI0023DE3C55|nr:MFS transporter [Acidovorax sp. SUPP3334]GKT22449.1 MFS transporter [Acidovorax sp. SUPP3334]